MAEGGYTVQHTLMTWISTHFSTGNSSLDVMIIMGISLLVSTAFSCDFVDSFKSMKESFRKWRDDRFSLVVESKVTHTKWGETLHLGGCTSENKVLLAAVFDYIENMGLLKKANVNVQDIRNKSDGDNRAKPTNLYETMKTKSLQIRAAGSYIRVSSDISVRVEVVEEAMNATGGGGPPIHTCRMTVMSRASFENCRGFLQEAYDHHVDVKYKKFDDDDEHKKLKYFSVRGIDHDNGNITWNQYPLTTSRTFDYVFFNDKVKVMDLLDKFLSNGPKQKGALVEDGGDGVSLKRVDLVRAANRPANKLGFLLYGKPGCGKTSFIKALANYTGRHIFDISLGKFQKNSELRDAFFTESIGYRRQGSDDDDPPSRWVPLDQRIIILEDIDCLDDLVKKRSSNTSYRREYEAYYTAAAMQQQEATKKDLGLGTGLASATPGAGGPGPGMHGMPPSSAKSRDDDSLNLSTLLNILDGTLELSGPIVVMTTNHPEHLDPALIRSGRITRQIYFGDLSTSAVREMLKFYYGNEVTQERIEEAFPHYKLDLDKKIPPNDLESLCLANSTFDALLRELKEYLARHGEVHVRVDEVRVSQEGDIEEVKRGVEHVVWRTSTVG
eukprot:TRINITY_DN3343_c0_g2_i1.p1 TRINITY_DN3343_c0_g2~~TRINITY_DN3343_c0_g2_i1.p1  ORF type:complete len:612 (-),score=138.35 TRINITY_DN3343_c0_g2_i1:33-1868(-)